MRTRRALGLVVCLTLLAACNTQGPADSANLANSDDANSDDSDDATAPLPIAEATVPASLPPQVANELGTLTVIGEPLPKANDAISTVADPARGLPAPVLVGHSFSGDEIRIDATTSGRATLIVFLAHWCPHCNVEVPVLNELRDSNAFPADLDIYGVSTRVDPNQLHFPPSTWLTDVDWTYPTLVDGITDDRASYLAYEMFGVSYLPTAVLIKPDGTVAARWWGEVPGPTVVSNITTYLSQ